MDSFQSNSTNDVQSSFSHVSLKLLTHVTRSFTHKKITRKSTSIPHSQSSIVTYSNSNTNARTQVLERANVQELVKCCHLYLVSWIPLSRTTSLLQSSLLTTNNECVKLDIQNVWTYGYPLRFQLLVPMKVWDLTVISLECVNSTLARLDFKPLHKDSYQRNGYNIMSSIMSSSLSNAWKDWRNFMESRSV